MHAPLEVVTHGEELEVMAGEESNCRRVNYGGALQDSETSSTGAEVSTTVDILETIANDIESIVKVTLSA